MSVPREPSFHLRPWLTRAVLVLPSPALEHLTVSDGGFRLHRVRYVPTVDRSLREAPAATAVVLDPYDGTGRTLSAELGELVRRHPMASSSPPSRSPPPRAWPTPAPSWNGA